MRNMNNSNRVMRIWVLLSACVIVYIYGFMLCYFEWPYNTNDAVRSKIPRIKFPFEISLSNEEKKSTPAIKDVDSPSKFGSDSSLVPLQKGTRQSGEEIETKKTNSTLVCNFEDPRSDYCEMDGDIRVHGKTNLVLLISHQSKTYKVRPYARKGYGIMKNIKEINIKSMDDHSNNDISCDENHGVPVIIFSQGGYNGNYFHDFTDFLVPLFITSIQYNGEVQFLITNIQKWWIFKYKEILKSLSRYEIIDFDNEEKVHCYPHAIVGLQSHKELSIDPTRAPNGSSMLDFSKFLRTAYSLNRTSSIKLEKKTTKKPRLLFFARKKSRKLVNTIEFVNMVTELGFEVLLEDPPFVPVAPLVELVNSCDVVLGVHGAGLTNLLFLPENSVVIQVVPFGGLEGLCWNEFGVAALDLNFKYIQYNIEVEESTLLDEYSREDPVFTNIPLIQKRGWMELSEIYLTKQSVRLNLTRFKPVLVEALEYLTN